MRLIKSLLLRTLGQERYLRLTSRVFFFAFASGLLKGNPSYRTHYLVRRFIKTGDTVLDIGANLGYYSRPFARYVGAQGAVLAVEPIALYRSVLERNVARLPQVTVLPFALGEQEGTARMGNPSTDKHRHGLMRVLTPEEQAQTDVTYEVQVKHPVAMFGHLPRIDYIKCDIEGYEVPVLPAMRPLLERNRPIVQVETDGENRTILFNLFTEIHYTMWYAGQEGPVAYDHPEKVLPGDLIAIPREKCEVLVG